MNSSLYQINELPFNDAGFPGAADWVERGAPRTFVRKRRFETQGAVPGEAARRFEGQGAEPGEAANRVPRTKDTHFRRAGLHPGPAPRRPRPHAGCRGTAP